MEELILTGYRRFAAYVYEYQNGKKGDNCGFVRVEVKNGICSMDLCLNNGTIKEQETCKIYGFVRNNGLMDGILLGECETERGKILGRITTEALNMGNSGVSLGRLGGMILFTSGARFYGTEWDDEAIRPDHFRERRIEKRREETEGSNEEPTKESVKISEAGGSEETGKAFDEEAAEKAVKIFEVGVPEENRKMSDEESAEEAVKISEAGVPEAPGKALDEESEETAVKISEVEVSEAPEEASDEDSIEEAVKISEAEVPGENWKESNEESTEEIIKISEAEISEEHQKESEEYQTEEMKNRFETAFTDSIPSRRKQASQNQSLKITALPNGFCPFADCDTISCRKIHPQELPRYSRKLCMFRNNRFLQRGYHNFGHILLCRKENGQYLLGVPGIYHPQERVAAEMSGFPFFKESVGIRTPCGRGGYWYRMIE